MRGKLRRLLWIAATPLALTLCLAAPGRAESTEAGPHAAESAGGHHVLSNPIQNFADSFWDYRNRDDHGGPLEPGDHKMPAPFALALVNFAALLFLVGKFAAPSFARMVRERHTSIAEALAEGARLRDEARKKLEEYTAKLASLQAEIDSLAATIRAEAEVEKQRLVADAQARAERMKADAEKQIQAEIQRVKTTLERDVMLQAVAIAEKLLKDRTTDSDQRRLTETLVSSLKAASTTAPRQ
jgi:F-type H+-transporting ATPase subunit b